MEIMPQDLEQLLKDQQVLLVDIREPWEVEICSIEPSVKIPMGYLLERKDDLETDKQLVLYCHHGVRTLRAVVWLQHQGIEALSLKGGIAAWSEVIDPSCPTY